MAEYTKFQQKVIRNYYEHREGIAILPLDERLECAVDGRRVDGRVHAGQGYGWMVAFLT